MYRKKIINHNVAKLLLLQARTSSIMITTEWCNWCWLLWCSATPPLMTTLDYFHWIEVQRGQASLLVVIDGLYIKYYWRLEGWGERGTCWRYLWLIASPTLLIGNTFYYKETFLLKTNGGKTSILGLLFTSSQQTIKTCSIAEAQIKFYHLEGICPSYTFNQKNWRLGIGIAVPNYNLISSSLLVSSSHPHSM